MPTVADTVHRYIELLAAGSADAAVSTNLPGDAGEATGGRSS